MPIDIAIDTALLVFVLVISFKNQYDIGQLRGEFKNLKESYQRKELPT